MPCSEHLTVRTRHYFLVFTTHRHPLSIFNIISKKDVFLPNKSIKNDKKDNYYPNFYGH